ncbi:MAG: ATP-dependent zinc metalloprotease FtsH [Planctomycetota bacterium]
MADTPPVAPPQQQRARWLPILLLTAVAIAVLMSYPSGEDSSLRDLSKIREAIRNGEVAELHVRRVEHLIEGKLRSVGEATPVAFSTAVPTDDVLTAIVADVEEWNRENAESAIDFTVVGRPNPYFVALLNTLPWIFLVGVMVWLTMRNWKQMSANMGGGPGGVGRSRVQLVDVDRPRVTFDDVAGIQEAKEEVYELIQFLRDPGRFQRLGGRIPRGVLLVGSPGTGKTLLAKAVAGEADVPFFSLSGSDFVEMFVGVGASRVRDLFRRARENSPCIIFLDEVDAIGRRRGSHVASGSEEREHTLNAILVEMDGFESDSGVIVIAATNRPDVLDPALLRPGRFDREICVDLPDMPGRVEILSVHTRKVPLADNVDLQQIARGTPSFSGADLEAMVNEAALLAALEEREQVEQGDLEEARDKVCWGRAKKSRLIAEHERRVTAFHEAGHAILAHLIDVVEPLHKATIIPRGPALGATMQLPEQDSNQLTRATAIGQLQVLFGGRIAESRFCGDLSSGASNDLERATTLAQRMVCEWGMSASLGPIVCRAPGDELHGEVHGVGFGEAVRAQVDDEIRALIDSAYKAAEELIEVHAGAVEAIADALLDRETLVAADVVEILDAAEAAEPALS